MKSFFGSDYDNKKGRLYLATNARYLRDSDTIVIWFAYTPTKRVSKYYNMLRLNVEYYGKPTDTELERILERKLSHKEIDFPKLPKGYTWSEPHRYS